MNLTAQQVDALLFAKAYAKAHQREYVRRERWYPWQHDSFETDRRQAMLMAGNRSGKTQSAAYHFALDVTQQYPDWWAGFKFAQPVNALALGVDHQQLRSVVQTQLFGEVDPAAKKFTGGWIHPSEVEAVEWSNHTPNLAHRVSIRGRYGRSAITLRAYSQSKTGQATLSFAGSSIDLVWVDECPPDPLVGQLVTRTMTGCGGKGGRIKFTMTPELGVTNLVDMFMNRRGPDMHLVGPIAWSQCPHLTPEVQESILAAIPDHEREMRSKGIPFFGSGLVYPVPESRLLCEPFRLEELPWGRTIRAMDLGIDHPTAAVWLLWDPEFDVIYVTRDYSRSGEPAAVHASILNSFMQDAPVVFPPDVDQTEKGSGKTVRTWYAEAGLKNTRDFENPDGTRYVEPGIMEILERMKTDRLKIFRGCDHLLRELRLYHRKDGSLVKQNDDVLDALRYGVQMIKRHGTPISRGHRTMKKVKRAMDA